MIDSVSGRRGAILMLHQIREDSLAQCNPNRTLAVAPEFFGELAEWVEQSDYDVIPIGAVSERLERMNRGEKLPPFLVFTFDDGYLDNFEAAAPVLRHHKLPYTIYVATGLLEGTANLWWAALEWVLEAKDRVTIDFGSGAQTFSCERTKAKCDLFDRLMHHCQFVLTEREQRAFVNEFCHQHEVDIDALSRVEMMTMEQVRELSQDPLCTIGAHTVNHYSLGRLDEDQARKEMRAGAEVLAAVTGQRPLHFAYPYGNPHAATSREFALAQELGFATAVTTRKGALYQGHSNHLYALPRVSINGYYQSLSFTKHWITGVPALIHNYGRKVNVT